jgi:hypothetical protein
MLGAFLCFSTGKNAREHAFLSLDAKRVAPASSKGINMSQK